MIHNCGISIDRDLNASLNIRNIGLNTVGHTGINACGDGSLESSLKQEKECLVNQAEALGLAPRSVTIRQLEYVNFRDKKNNIVMIQYIQLPLFLKENNEILISKNISIKERKENENVQL